MSSGIDKQHVPQNPPSGSTKLGINNALTHGGTSDKLILPGEAEADFASLLEGLQDEYRPETAQHRLFVEQLAIAHWFLWRRQRAYNAIEERMYSLVDGALEWLSTEHLHRLALADRYKAAAERALKRALHNAESIRKERKNERDFLERRARRQGEQEHRDRRLTHQEQTRTLKVSAPHAAASQPPAAIRFAKNALSSPSLPKEQIHSAQRLKCKIDPNEQIA